MTFDFSNFGGRISTVHKCMYDSNIAYEATLNNNGDVDNWTYYDGIHTYGCWGGFLFGTLYKSYACIGMSSVISPIKAENFYLVKIVMKLNIKKRAEGQNIPQFGKLMWRTVNSTTWSDDKSHTFNVKCDGNWNSYNLNLSSSKLWQGEINDIRVLPINEDGRKGDEFFIRVIQITSNGYSICRNKFCSFYSSYTSPCKGVGNRAVCKSDALPEYIEYGRLNSFSEDRKFNINSENGDYLIININDYGYEKIKIDHIENCSGNKLSSIIESQISKVDVGGYAEATVSYSERGEFLFSSGTFTQESSVKIEDTPLARYLGFYTHKGMISHTFISGIIPASGFKEYSSFKIKTYQLNNLIDSNMMSNFSFDPNVYNIEGGRRDWLDNGLGQPTKDVRATESDVSGLMSRNIDYMDNAGKTLIDFNHPINASGRIRKVYAAVTLDTTNSRGAADANRKLTQLSNAVIMFFRPNIDGSLRVLPYEVPIKNREHSLGKLYSALQEYVELDCDVYLNKGDLIGIYNANVYVGRSITGKEIDATYYQVNGKPVTGTFVDTGSPYGSGSSGIMVYVRSDRYQDRLVVDLDFGKRVNVSNIELSGRSDSSYTDFNIARCIDINWSVDLFNGDHTTGYETENFFMPKVYYNHPNIAYGINCLSDGIKVVPDGIAADGFSVSMKNYYEYPTSKQDGGAGVIPLNPRYFHCNGDLEWIGVYMLAGTALFALPDFENDPIAFTIKFPFGEEKLIYKSKVYFKERYNFRSFALSTFNGEGAVNGNADDKSFSLIPKRSGYNTPWTRVNLDGLDYLPDDEFTWSDINSYLAENPCIGSAIIKVNKGAQVSYDPILANYTDDNGLQYSAGGVIINNDQFTQATAVDWTTIEHEWEPISAKGFRLYCNDHKSTKICEMELYCKVDGAGMPISNMVDVVYSDYGDYWWTTDSKSDDNVASIFIGDSPRYINISIRPASEMSLDSINVNISKDVVYVGESGCVSNIYPIESLTKSHTNKAEPVIFKNVYGQPYTLSVDINRSDIGKYGTMFFSLMNNDSSIKYPLVGPSSYYKKHSEFVFRNYNNNVAINCPVYGLRNIIKGKKAWYTYDKDYSWTYFRELNDTHNINFSNLPDMSITTINLPILSRSKWWKIGTFDQRVVMSIREIQVYYRGEEIPAKFYYSKDQDVNFTPNTDPAPHINNHIIDGSYYIIGSDNYIGIELPDVQEIDKIIIYNDRLTEFENSHNKAGIDGATALCIHGTGLMYQVDSINDDSYYEHALTIADDKVYCDNSSSFNVSYDFIKDFTSCEPLYKKFDESTIDTSFWTNINNATIASGVLNITNSGIIGSVTTIDYLTEDFNTTVNLTNISGAYPGVGWGCYIQVESDIGSTVRVGREYSQEEGSVMIASQYSGGGWSIVDTVSNADTSGLSFRLSRAGSNVYCYGRGSDNVWRSMGSSSAVGNSNVRVSLISNLTPLSIGVTTASFDDFYIDAADSGWSVNGAYDSTFTCTSGIGPNGSACVFDTICARHADAAAYKLPVIFDTQSNPFDEQFAFVMDFSFRMSQFLTSPTGTSTNDCGVAVGLIGKHVRDYRNYWYVYDWYEHFTGAQVVLRRDNIGIAILNDVYDTTEIYTALNTTANTYFCRFTGDGLGNYNCSVWTDWWSGSSKVVDLNLQSNIRWQVNKVGFGSGYHGRASEDNYRARGWISDIDFSCTKTSRNYILDDSSIRFNESPSGIRVAYNNSPICNVDKNGFDFGVRGFFIEFFLRFNSLPKEDGTVIYLMKSWADTRPVNNAAANNQCSWALTIEVESSYYYWRFYANINGTCRRVMDHKYTPDLYRWNHYCFARGYDEYPSRLGFICNGYKLFQDVENVMSSAIFRSMSDVVIGQNLDGWMDEIRVSSDDDPASNRFDYVSSAYEYLNKIPPYMRYKRYYTMSIYNSHDNVFYGKDMDVDVLYKNTKSYREPFSLWSETYYSFFAVDMGQRHNISIIRSYPVDTSYQFNNDYDVFYSNKDTDDPLVAFRLEDYEANVSTNFYGDNYDYPKNWTRNDSIRSQSYILDDAFTQKCSPLTSSEYSKAESKFILSGDFDFHIDYDLGQVLKNNNSWSVSITIADINKVDNVVRFDRCFKSGSNQVTMWSKDNDTTWVQNFVYYTQPTKSSVRLTRSGAIFGAYTKNVEDPVEAFALIGNHQAVNGFGKETRITLSLSSDSTSYPEVVVRWENFVLTSGNVMFSSKADARWMRIKMLNGDGVSRVIKNLDVFPDITKNSNAAGEHNTYWDYLGSSVTSYGSGENLAATATISGSSYVYPMILSNVNNGVILDGDLLSCWGSDDETNPWIDIHMVEESPIYRVKIYHGYSTKDTTNMITDYKIQYSTDGSNFSTMFTITGNTSYERTHDLVTPIYAKVVRIYVDAYKALKRFVMTSEGVHKFWSGAVLREVEVYKHYGFNLLNSEDYPIISIDLRQQFFIKGHSLIGPYAENSTVNWSNSDSNFAWSGNRMEDPSKAVFSAWGSAPTYERWVAIKRNTATHYPTEPTPATPETDNKDYLKHVVIKGNVDEIGNSPIPIEYHWMWESDLSNLSNDYNVIGSGKLGSRTLRIDYPSSVESDHIRFIEGDHFGWDDACSPRDGLGIHLYIDDVSNIDLGYGYIYVGGFDNTQVENPITFVWNIATIKHVLQTGWNQLSLCFMTADTVSYTKIEDHTKKDPRIPYSIKWGKAGIVFRGVGNSLQLNIEGLYISRNYFAHTSYPGQYGLYIHNQEFLKSPISGIDLSAFTLEFWIRPDWGIDGKDIYNDYRLRTLFHVTNTNNDILGAQVSSRGMEVYYGNLLTNLNLFVITKLPLKIRDTAVHMAFVCSNTGKNIDTDGSTVRVYINNTIVGKTDNAWEVSENKHFDFKLGGQGILPLKNAAGTVRTSAVDGVVSRLKVYNYCKTDFTSSITDSEDNYRFNTKSPNDYIELSNDNVTFFSLDSKQLPLVFSDVANGEEVTVWVKVNKSETYAANSNSTASIIGSWEIGV